MEITNFRELLLLYIQVPLFAIVIGLELILANVKQQKIYTLKETIHNVYLSVACFVVDFCVRLMYLYFYILVFNNAIFHWEEKGWVYWISLIVFQDFMFYWLHRNDHFIRFFWATHVTHHSAVHYNISVGFRSSVLEPIYRFVYFLPIVFVGYEPLDVMFVFSATQLWGTLIHTKVVGKLPAWIEYIFVTPSHHRVHHASNPKYLDKNMGMFLIIWDRMFGTFQEELDEKKYQPIKYGLTSNLEKPNAFTLIFHEFISIIKDVFQKNLTWKERLMYIFGPPGYSHDGSRKTSKLMLQEEEHLKQSITDTSYKSNLQD